MNHIPLIESKQRILVAPLNWGLGHASRCISIIYELLQQNHEVIYAADNSAFLLLQQEFPLLEGIHLSDINIRYSAQKSQSFSIAKQIPKIVKNAFKEHDELQKIIVEKNISMVISDNRFGLFTNLVPCMYITHQIHIQLPFIFRFLEPFATWIHRKIIENYSACWIPDFRELENCLAGKLSHPNKLPKNAIYIGPLSRFTWIEANAVSVPFHTVAIISGPEPHRSILEQKILLSLKDKPYKSLLVGGEFSNRKPSTVGQVLWVNQLPSNELKAYLSTAKKIICRSGYSSIMDLHAIGRSAQIIATPGQPEQEYLEKYLTKKNLHRVYIQTDE